MQKYSSNSKETEELGLKLSGKLKGNEIIAFYGGMGMGKTTFIRGLMKGLNAEDEVSSPTFAIVNEYDGKYKVYHFDMYRVQSEEDLESTGFYDYIDNGILLIEWSENVEEFIPESAIKITIKQGRAENERIILIAVVNMDW